METIINLFFAVLTMAAPNVSYSPVYGEDYGYLTTDWQAVKIFEGNHPLPNGDYVTVRTDDDFIKVGLASDPTVKVVVWAKN